MSKRSSSLTETKSLISKDHLSKFDERRPAGYPSDKEIPVVLVLKRKAIRVYPDNQKVVLYYSQALDKYVSIPFGPKSDVLGSPLNESRKPRKPREDRDSDLYKALASKYPGIASQYKKAKEEQPERRALRRMAMKLTRKQKEALSPEERDAIYKTSKEIVKASPMPVSHRLGTLTGLWAQKKWADYKARKQPTSVTESYKQKVNALRGNQIDEAWEDWALRGLKAVDTASDIATVGGLAAAIPTGGASLPAAAGGVAGKLAMKYGGKKARNWLANRLAQKKLRNMAGKPKGKGRGGKLAGAAAAGLGAIEALKGVGGAAAQAASTGRKYGGAQPHQFSLQPTVGGPGQRLTADPSTIEGKVARSMIQQMRESSNIDKIKYIVENNINSYEMTFEGNDSTINLNNRVAKKVLQVYETLNTKNQKKFSKMLNENATTFKQAINFVIRH